MGAFCVRFGAFCRANRRSCQVRHKKDRFGYCNRNPYGVVLVFSWLMVFIAGSAGSITALGAETWLFLVLSGLATGASWLCCYKALQDGIASVVVPIDKLSILVSVGFSAAVFKERLSKKSAAGLLLIVAGTLMMLIK